MFSEKEIKQKNIDQHRHIMSMCGDESLEKAISMGEFKESYGLTHEIYPINSIDNYRSAVADKINENPENAEAIIEKAMEEFKPLSKVLVKSEDRVETFYVREKTEGDMLKSLETEVLAEKELEEFLKGEAEAAELEKEEKKEE